MWIWIDGCATPGTATRRSGLSTNAFTPVESLRLDKCLSSIALACLEVSPERSGISVSLSRRYNYTATYEMFRCFFLTAGIAVRVVSDTLSPLIAVVDHGAVCQPAVQTGRWRKGRPLLSIGPAVDRCSERPVKIVSSWNHVEDSSAGQHGTILAMVAWPSFDTRLVHRPIVSNQ